MNPFCAAPPAQGFVHTDRLRGMVNFHDGMHGPAAPTIPAGRRSSSPPAPAARSQIPGHLHGDPGRRAKSPPMASTAIFIKPALVSAGVDGQHDVPGNNRRPGQTRCSRCVSPQLGHGLGLGKAILWARLHMLTLLFDFLRFGIAIGCFLHTVFNTARPRGAAAGLQPPG